MTEEMKNYLKDFNERHCKNVLNEWYVRSLPIKKQIDCMDNHEEIRKKWKDNKEDIIESILYCHDFSCCPGEGFSNWGNLDESNEIDDIRTGADLFTDYALCAFFPLESLKDNKYVEWIIDYQELVKEFINKVINLRRNYNSYEESR